MHVQLSKYLSKERNCTHTCATGDVIPGLTDGLVAITARALMANSPHVVCGRVAQLTCGCLAPPVRRRLAPHHLQPPQRVCSSCADFLTASACVSTRACVYVHHSSCLWWAWQMS